MLLWDEACRSATSGRPFDPPAFAPRAGHSVLAGRIREMTSAIGTSQRDVWQREVHATHLTDNESSEERVRSIRGGWVPELTRRGRGGNCSGFEGRVLPGGRDAQTSRHPFSCPVAP